MALENYFVSELRARLTDPSHGLRSICVFDVSGDDGGVWSIDFNDGSVTTGAAPAECTVALGSADLRELLHDPDRSGALLLRGKIRVTGNDSHALRFFQFLGMSLG